MKTATETSLLNGPQTSSTTPAIFWLFWLLPVSLSVVFCTVGHLTLGAERISKHWSMTLTAFFGSMISGGTPEGGSSVYFPVMTVLLECKPSLSRNFGLCIQAVGMSMATLRILVTRTTVDWTVILIALPPAAITEILVLLVRDMSNPANAAFSPPFMQGPAIDVTFMIIVMSMAFISFLLLSESESESQGDPPPQTEQPNASTHRDAKDDASIQVPTTLGWALPDYGTTLPPSQRRRMRPQDATHGVIEGWTTRRALFLCAAAGIGGLLSGATATGTNMLVYLAVVACFDLSPKVAVPTTVVLTAALSILGTVVLLSGRAKQLDVHVNMTSGLVLSVGGVALDPPCPISSCDLPGLLAAAAPVVVWGAPIGAELTRRLPEEAVLAMIVLVALAAVLGIFFTVEGLHHASLLLAYALGGLVASPVLIYLLRRHRRALFPPPHVPASAAQALVQKT